MTRLLKLLLLLTVILLLFAGAWFSRELGTPLGRTEGKIVFEIAEGKSVAAIARELREQGVIRRTWPFLLSYRLFHSSSSLKAGEYEMEGPVSSRDVLNALIEGRIRLHALTVPEGLTRLEIARHLADEYGVSESDFMAASSEPDPISDWDDQARDLEGYLFPETYFFPRETPARTIVAAMVRQFHENFPSEWSRRAGELGLSGRETVILASLIEEETALPSERPLVSAVFHNRLRIGMKLDCDPTIAYALKLEGRYTGRLLTRDLRWDTPFNTYLHRGLPPGPITNPGRSSLRAALYPAEADYLYFVSRNDGSHFFSRTYREHREAVNRYQRRIKR